MGLSDTILFKNKIGDKINAMLHKDSIYKITCASGELPFLCLELTFNQNSEVPLMPLDNNSVITDNVIIGNTSLHCKLSVKYDDVSKFKDYLEKGNLDKKGFSIVTLSYTYENMRWTSANYSETTDNVSGVIYDLSFIEIRSVEAKTGFISYTKIPKKPQNASKVQNGKVDPVQQIEDGEYESIAHSFFGSKENAVQYVKDGIKNSIRAF
ncbi:hypothetical protein CQA66_08430 [Helicobacter aurati]|uniref:Dit-like phage tail protein N-terminal domain-containing protein n=1 Tax=Helicobacter aurati TaxID=137778 RepID=A0A3D8IZU1_9HELI|nr:hypothetical protein [Helicobacter aurati]RDU70425.1 hypothetical protein CQA66_08430 [Helicobacter aurati]